MKINMHNVLARAILRMSSISRFDNFALKETEHTVCPAARRGVTPVSTSGGENAPCVRMRRLHCRAMETALSAIIRCLLWNGNCTSIFMSRQTLCATIRRRQKNGLLRNKVRQKVMLALEFGCRQAC